ncbi:nucleopolyhedrovirus P10 family protein [Streptomyces physcomitrii]|uniref:Nucleopolyhedrovirus P10 family protein n=1 Tax=Streptomyces physcomitrii TaxID=2724184 RepID=A0ABX1GYM0_9ACTN|nr:nucleopolyhedrovirus P10 family protein [Streptomyces physcomitrii]NKI41186.1 nucleopolyhedrovirus P10 family protein [Streptomyces physcomitrii]
MTADQWTRRVREQLGLGRLLPLGGVHGGAWLAESAARGELLRAAAHLAGVRVGALRVGPLEGAATREPAVPPPASALRPGPLRLTAEFAAAGTQPLPASGAQLRAVLEAAAGERLGLDLARIDLRATGLLDVDAEAAAPRTEDAAGREAEDARTAGSQDSAAATTGPGGASAEEERVRQAAVRVPGVARLTGMLGGLGRPVHLETVDGGSAALPRRHARVELAVARGHQALEVALAVRRAVGAALPDEPSVAVVVTAIDGEPAGK